MIKEMIPHNMEWIENACDVWLEILEEGNICARDMVVFIISDDDRINTETVKALSIVLFENNATRLILISDSDSVKKDIYKLHEDSYVFLKKTKTQINNLLRLYYLYPFSDRIIINDGREYLDGDPYLLDGTCSINLRDILEICFLKCRRKSKKDPVRQLSYRRIDWDHDSVRDRFRHCRNTGDIISELIRSKSIDRNKKIVVFACNETMKAVTAQLKAYDFDVDVILDNGSGIGSYYGINVKKPENYLKSSVRDVYILVTSRHYKEICEQLYFMGFEYGKTVFVTHGSYLEEKTLFDIEEEMKNEIMSGYEVYSDLRNRYPKHHFIIQPAKGTGDMYLACLYLRKTTVHSKELLYITKSSGYASIAGTMDIQYEILDEKKVFSLISFLRSNDRINEDATVINTDFRQRCANLIWGYKGLDFNTFLQKTLYKTDNTVVPEKIKQENSDQIFDDNKLKKGKTVLFSPYASASRMIDMDFWKRIADFFTDNGYSVCTNINGAEKPVPGTTGLSIPYSRILDFVDKAGYFMGVRSGLCDILSSTEAHMIILYFDQPASDVGGFYDFFSLLRMGLRKEKTLEFLYMDQNDSIERIKDYINS